MFIAKSGILRRCLEALGMAVREIYAPKFVIALDPAGFDPAGPAEPTAPHWPGPDLMEMIEASEPQTAQDPTLYRFTIRVKKVVTQEDTFSVQAHSRRAALRCLRRLLRVSPLSWAWQPKRIQYPRAQVVGVEPIDDIWGDE